MATRVDAATTLTAELGKRLREVRLERRCSKAKLATALGISIQDIQRYEDGKHQISVPILILMCEALGAHPMEIIGRSVETLVHVRKTPNVVHKRLLVAQQRLEDICRQIAEAN